MRLQALCEAVWSRVSRRCVSATVDRFTSAQITAAHLNGIWVLLET